MALDTSIYNALAQPRKTAFDYQREFAQADQQREQAGQARQINALALQQGQERAQDAARTRADEGALRAVLQGGGGAGELRKLGTRGGIEAAAEEEARASAAARGQSQAADAARAAEASRLSEYRDMIDRGFVSDRPAAEQWTRAQFADPVIAPRLQRMGLTVDDAVARIPSDPGGLRDWMERQALGLSGQIKSQAEAQKQATQGLRVQFEGLRTQAAMDAARGTQAAQGARLNIDQQRLELDRSKAAREAATGPKLSPVLEKELIETDEMVQQAGSAAQSLKDALALNSKMYSGLGAKERAIARSNLPGQRDATADNTIMYDNIILGQALESLKATFGGSPTEGERQILVDIQASVNKSPEQRQRILERAMQTLQRREAANAAKAAAIRSGTYTSQGAVAPQAAQPAQAAPAARQPQASGPLQQARDAIARGAPREAVIQRLRQNGIDPKGL